MGVLPCRQTYSSSSFPGRPVPQGPGGPTCAVASWPLWSSRSWSQGDREPSYSPFFQISVVCQLPEEYAVGIEPTPCALR